MARLTMLSGADRTIYPLRRKISCVEKGACGYVQGGRGYIELRAVKKSRQSNFIAEEKAEPWDKISRLGFL